MVLILDISVWAASMRFFELSKYLHGASPIRSSISFCCDSLIRRKNERSCGLRLTLSLSLLGYFASTRVLQVLNYDLFSKLGALHVPTVGITITHPLLISTSSPWSRDPSFLLPVLAAATSPSLLSNSVISHSTFVCPSELVPPPLLLLILPSSLP